MGCGRGDGGDAAGGGGAQTDEAIHAQPTDDAARADDPAAPQDAPRDGEDQFIANARQLTFEGLRSGEGYFSADGSMMIFQSEREAGNPFYQIYVMDLDTGDTRRVSPGYGKTTCAWIHPDGKHAMFASTHDDAESSTKQKDELDLRAGGKQRRYAWDYDEHFDLYEVDLSDPSKLKNLTNAKGYDAEGAYSPDGRHIVFASNRHAYTTPLSEADAKEFKLDPSHLMDIYIMDADGGNVRRLTDVPGYDGGAFFSADGKKVCWRRFGTDKHTAEVFTMNLDGSEQKQITRMGAMSWAPYFHPSGQYLIYTTNVHGFDNFELYIVAADGSGNPVRVTFTAGFDGLPTFSPNGATLSWTTNRTSSGQSQIFIAQWNHEAALKALRLSGGAPEARTAAPVIDEAQVGQADISATDLKRHVVYLASEQLEGRMTGTEGERLATAYAAELFERFGLMPAGEGGTYFQSFEFTAGVKLGPGNKLFTEQAGGYTIDEQWRPLAFSKTGEVPASAVVFAGYGIVAPASDGIEEYDSYVHLDVKDKWVMVFRFMPEGVEPKVRQHLARYASLRYKVMVARDRGARGLIVVSGPNSNVRQQLVELGFDASLAGTSIAGLSVTDDLAGQWLAGEGKNLKQLQDELDTGEPMMGFELKALKLGAAIDIQQEKRTGRNVLARLNAGDGPGKSAIVIGAHIDHLGRGGSGSLAGKGEEQAIHYGADDNASGVAAMIEVAQWLADQKQRGKLAMKHDVIFAGWSGEELGLLGSAHYVRHFLPGGDESASLSPAIIACLNMDMVGRYETALTLQGVGSSGEWTGLIERANVPVGLNLTISGEAYLPTDATSFYMRGVPVLSAFTGAHAEYHTPRDTPDLLNYDGAANVAKFMGLVTRSLAMRDEPMPYVAMKKPEGEQRAGLRAYLGTIPDYSQGDVKGLKISGVAKDGPADKAGMKAGDVIIELAGRKIENIYDYTYAIEALKIGQPVDVAVSRAGQRVVMKITPQSRQ